MRKKISENPLYDRLKRTNKSKIKTPALKFKISKIGNVGLVTSPKARIIIKKQPNLIPEFLRFIKQSKTTMKTSSFLFRRLEQKSFLIIVENTKFIVQKITKPKDQITPQKWASHAFNSAVIVEALKKQGINTVPLHFAFTNLKKKESFLAYEHLNLKNIKQAREEKIITEKEHAEFKENMLQIYTTYRDKIKTKELNIGLRKEKLSFFFTLEEEVLIDPTTKKLYVNPTTETRENLQKKLASVSEFDVLL